MKRDRLSLRGVFPARVAGFSPLAALLALAAMAAAARADGPARRPNVLFFYSDDQRADTVAALGNPHIRTPTLDSLARGGVALTRVYCNGSLKGGAVCIPSRAMLMTGRSLFRVDEEMKGQDTWPAAFAASGYDTFATGKWHNGKESLRKTFKEAEAVFFGGMGDPYALPLVDLGPGGTLVNERVSVEHSVKLFADAASRFLEAHGGKNSPPFLCYVAFNFPHDPRTAPAEYRARYRDDAMPLPANYLPEHPFDNGELSNRDEKLAPWPRTPEVVRRHLADYYASIEYLDAQVGRILRALEDSGHGADTLVVFASDHGLAIGSHGLFGKQNLYEHSMRSPVLIKGPGIPAGRKIDALAYLFDLFPTLGDLAGVPGPAGSEGLSLAPALRGEMPSRREDILTAYRQVQRAIRDDRWKLIVYPRINRSQLFDLASDPAELRDLSTDPAHAADLARMTALLRARRASAGERD
ncbi:Choline-sulfatase [Aquisphaera giovannonii]|uniref:Choline-sulfatase n=1 Tax=Aquisphaera giovannonii TaxID=406548 RepID=A0A5B9VT03_9BACT|nr:sulfatase-like hydrolase/transferase [Aquisphaera giovannonii]QEH31626.1 Choline-sulfatase [Aquisphaera giovannonii]